MAPFDVKLLLPVIPSHSLGKVSSTLSHPVGSRCYCFWSSVLFWWNTHQRTENYFSLRETDFGLKNCRRNYSKFDRMQHTQPHRLLLSFAKLAYLLENLLSALIASDLLPFYLAPVGLPSMFLTLLTKHYLPMGSLGAQLQGGSHLSLVTDKLKHDDIFNRPFVNILPCWKLRRVPSPLGHI